MKVNALQTLAGEIFKTGLTSPRKPEIDRPDFTNELKRIGQNQKPDKSASRELPDQTEDESPARPSASGDDSIKAEASTEDRQSASRADSEDEAAESDREESSTQQAEEADAEVVSQDVELSVQSLTAQFQAVHFNVADEAGAAAITNPAAEALVVQTSATTGDLNTLEAATDEQGGAEKFSASRSEFAFPRFFQPVTTGASEASSAVASLKIDTAAAPVGPVATSIADPNLIAASAEVSPDQAAVADDAAQSTAALSGSPSDQEGDPLASETLIRTAEKTPAKLSQAASLEARPALEPEQVLRNLKSHIQTDPAAQTPLKKSGAAAQSAAADAASTLRAAAASAGDPLIPSPGDLVVKAMESQVHFDSPAPGAAKSENEDGAASAASASASSRPISTLAAAFPSLGAISLQTSLADDSLLTSAARPDAIVGTTGFSAVSTDAPAPIATGASGSAASLDGEPGGIQIVNAQFSTPDEAEIDGADLARQAMRGIRGVVNQRGGAIKLQLTPPELGELRIQIKLENGVVRASFLASNETARRLLEQQSGMLRTALEAHGLRVENIQVQLQPSGGGQPGFMQDWQQSASDGQSRGSFEQNPSDQGAAGHRNQSGQENPARRFERELLDVTV